MTIFEIVVLSTLVPLSVGLFVMLDSNGWAIRTTQPRVNLELETHLAVFTDFSDDKLRRGLMLTKSEAKALYKIVKYHNQNSLFVPDPQPTEPSKSLASCFIRDNSD